jgi:hypothetical protein
MTFDKWFEEQSLIVKVILLIIPFVGWIVEILVRISAVLRNSSTINILGLILGVIGNWIWGIIDLIFLILQGNLLLLE